MEITLYTTHCPKCKVLMAKLQQKNITFDVCEDIEIIRTKGFLTVPLLEVDGIVMDFVAANKWVSEV